MTSFIRAKALAMVVVLVVLIGCESIIQGDDPMFDELHLDVESTILKGTSATLKAADANVLAYEQAMLATDVKDKTVTQAIKAYRISRQNGLEDQLVKAYDTTAIIIESDVAEKISQRANDPGFQKSWAEVKPHFDQSIGYFQISRDLQRYATIKITTGINLIFQWEHLKEDFSNKHEMKLVVLSNRQASQIDEYFPRLAKNYEELIMLDEQLQLIPDYAQAVKERKAAGETLTEQQTVELQKEADLAMSSGEIQFGLFFADEEQPADAAAPGQPVIDRKLEQHDYCSEVKTELKGRGYYTGKINGICGSISRKAIRDFKVDEGLEDNDRWTLKAAKILFGNSDT